MTPRTLEPNAQRLKRREVTQMSKTKKLLAAALAIVSLAAVPSTSIALSGSGRGRAARVRRTGSAVAARRARACTNEEPLWGSSCYSGERRRGKAIAAGKPGRGHVSFPLVRARAPRFTVFRLFVLATRRAPEPPPGRASASAWRFNGVRSLDEIRRCLVPGVPPSPSVSLPRKELRLHRLRRESARRGRRRPQSRAQRAPSSAASS